MLLKKLSALFLGVAVGISFTQLVTSSGLLPARGIALVALPFVAIGGAMALLDRGLGRCPRCGRPLPAEERLRGFPVVGPGGKTKYP